MTKHLWSEQDVRRVSAESMVDLRTIRRALAGESIRNTSKERISRAARKLGLRLPSVLALLALACGVESNGEALFGSGGAAGLGVAGSSFGGGAGEAATGGTAGQAAEASAGSAGATPDAGSEADAGPVSCLGSPSGWLGCNDNGCGVCVQQVAAYLHYFSNHPGCWPNSGTSCTSGGAFACSEACPPPTSADL